MVEAESRATAQAQAEANEVVALAQQATAEQLENFKKAFAVCLEAKDYIANY